MLHTGDADSNSNPPDSISETNIFGKFQGSVQVTELDRIEGVNFIKHQCGSHCLEDSRYQYKENQMRGTNPLLIPIGKAKVY